MKLTEIIAIFILVVAFVATYIACRNLNPLNGGIEMGVTRKSNNAGDGVLADKSKILLHLMNR